ncbi:MAG: DUF4906 domain-containing protein, partial [Alistipes sp.]|nr:DUF4906 domain-containing protein [Alistipes sp.]
LWVVQFIGETLKYAHQFTAAELTGSLSCPLSTEANSTVYFVANTGNALTVADGTTKTAFAAKTYPLAKIAYATNGAALPMVYTHTAQITSTSFTATLTPIVAKVRLALIDGTGGKFKPKTVQICNVPTNANLFSNTVAGSTNVTASYTADARTTFSTTAAPITLYVPENMQTAAVSGTRDGKNAQYATCIKVAGTYADTYEVTYSIYPGGTADYKIQRNNIYGITATIKGMNPNDTRVAAVCDLTPTGSETANCYMVSEGQIYYRFRANVMGNGATTAAAPNGNGAAITPAALAPKSAKIIWQQNSSNNTTETVISDVSIETIGGVPYVKFKTSGAYGSPVKEGNALIAVYTSTDGSGNPIWSWHIWSTAYKGATVTNTTRMTGAEYTSVQMMTRNLGSMGDTGALSYGLLYQWGRKDPFTNSFAATGTTAATVTGTNTTTVAIATSGVGAAAINYTIAHPTVFITNAADPYDWYSTTATTVTNFRKQQRDNLWGNGDRVATKEQAFGSRPANKTKGSKSIYDPCPPGYRVPPQGTWTNFTTDGQDTDDHSGAFATYANVSGTFSNGWLFYIAGNKTGATAWYPAAGYRSYSSGALTNVGSNGYCWSSSPYSETSQHAGSLSFGSGRVFPVYSAYRASGLSVRCAKNL